MGLLDILDEPAETPTQAAAPSNGLFAALRQGVEPGARNTAYTRLAGWLRARGASPAEIMDWLECVNKAHSTGLSAQEIQGICRSVGRYPVKLENRAPEAGHILTVSDCLKKWRDTTGRAVERLTGFDRLDNAMPFFGAGDVLTVAGRSGTLKTTLGAALGARIADRLGCMCLMVSLEMDAGALAFRLANMTNSEETGTEQDGHGTRERLLSDAAFYRRVEQRNKNILTIDRDSLTLEQVETYLALARERGQVEILVIDYLGYLTDAAPGSNYDKVSRLARGVKALAKRAQVRIILLCQTSRAGTDGTEPVQLHHLRDSGAIEESADNVLGLWHSTDENRLHTELLKCRHGRRGARFDFINTGLHLTEADFTNDKKHERF